MGSFPRKPSLWVGFYFPTPQWRTIKILFYAPIIIGKRMMPPSVTAQEKAHEEDPGESGRWGKVRSQLATRKPSSL